MTRRITHIFAFILCCFCLSHSARAEGEANHVRFRLIPEHQTVQGGENFYVLIEQTIDADWHTYWVNPGDAGAPMEVKWDMPTGFTAGEMLWAVPHTMRTGDLVSYGYAGKTTILQNMTVPNDLPAGALTFTAHIDVLVCSDICIPESATVSFTINDGTPENHDTETLLNEAYNAMPSFLEWDATMKEENGDLVVTIPLVQNGILRAMDLKMLRLFPYAWGVIDNAAKQSVNVDPEKIVIRVKRGTRPFDQVPEMKSVLVYGDGEGQRAGLDFKAYQNLPVAKKAEVAPVPAQKSSGGGGNGFLQAVLFAFLGGLVLNLMPCVFPILSMKALSLSKLGAKEQKTAVLYGVAYTAGVLLSFLAIAGVLIAVRQGGAAVGWGFHLQNPMVVLGLCWLLFLIGVNLAGLFEFGGALANLGSGFAAKHGISGSFFTGALATLVATPCTAPFMGSAIAYALLQPTAGALAVFAALGFGLAFPYLLICAVPFIRVHLPKPGAWMETFRQFLAFPMFASVVWLVWVYVEQVGSGGIVTVLGGMVALAFVIWLVEHKKKAMWLLPLAVLAIGYWGWTSDRASPTMTAEAFTQARLAELLDTTDEPVFVNMTAAWCITCKINEKAALARPETEKLFSESHVHYLKGDWTSRDKAISDYLETFHRDGVPLYVYYPPKDAATGTRPNPMILPQILTVGIVKDALMKSQK